MLVTPGFIAAKLFTLCWCRPDNYQSKMHEIGKCFQLFFLSRPIFMIRNVRYTKAMLLQLSEVLLALTMCLKSLCTVVSQIGMLLVVLQYNSFLFIIHMQWWTKYHVVNVRFSLE